MNPVEGARTFLRSDAAYDEFMGRYSRALAPLFADHAGVHAGQQAIDIGCGPGALTEVLLERLGADNVTAIDPSPPFVAACAARLPGVNVKLGEAEDLPLAQACADAVLSQLVLHFVTDASKAVSEMRRVAKPGATVASCMWDADGGMELLDAFWEAADLLFGEVVPGEAVLRFGKSGEVATIFEAAGLVDIDETTLQVSRTYADADAAWHTFDAGIGPAGAYLAELPAVQQGVLHAEFLRQLGQPSGPVTLMATARSVCAISP